MSHDIKNEICAILANHLVRELIKDIGGSFFSFLCDEYTDVANKEQLTFRLRWVNDDLQAFEDCLGKSQTSQPILSFAQLKMTCDTFNIA